MISPPRSIRPKSLTAILVLWLFLAAACGTTTSEVAVEPAAPAPEIVVTPLESAPVESGGHDYGISIAEWTVAEATSTDDAEPTPGELRQIRSDYTEIEWPDLIPEGMAGDEIFSRYEQRFDDLEVGSPEAQVLYEEMLTEMDSGAANADLDGAKVRLAGFVAPLTYDGDIVTEFLLVPNFGACIHVPPPPPNQTVVVTVDRANGLTLEESWGPVWVEGTLAVSAETTELAAASYTITSATSGVYEF